MAPSAAPASLESLESQWLEQMKAMKAALAELNISQVEDGVKPYGHDIHLNERPPASSTEEENLWDLISDEDDEEFSDQTSSPLENGHESPIPVDGTAHDIKWLSDMCKKAVSSKPGVDAEELLQQLTSLLASDSAADELQALLVDTLGFEELDMIAELLSYRSELLQNLAAKESHGKLANGLQTREQRMEALRQQDAEHKSVQLAPAADRAGAHYPHVYKAHDAGNSLSAFGRKYALPQGSERTEHQKYEEYTIPASKVGRVAANQRLVPIATLDGLCKRTFKGYTTLNRMQSLLYDVAYHTNENMLVCAPTGAGKTDAAMLTILHAIGQNLSPSPIDNPDVEDFAVESESFKIVYVAPMKALAAEITEKFAKRLAWLGIACREFTGDMHLTKKEIQSTNIIVTTPEKWDVVTRKSTGDTELVQKVRLLIIDEVCTVNVYSI